MTTTLATATMTMTIQSRRWRMTKLMIASTISTALLLPLLFVISNLLGGATAGVESSSTMASSSRTRTSAPFLLPSPFPVASRRNRTRKTMKTKEKAATAKIELSINQSSRPICSASTSPTTKPLLSLRCGDASRHDDDGQKDAEAHANDDNNDEERYSRQLYTLGARAHKLVRSSTVYVDGPLESGLLWECCKNLALSGVGKLVVLTTQSNTATATTESLQEGTSWTPAGVELAYHDQTLDDLGKTYIRGARAEIMNGDVCAVVNFTDSKSMKTDDDKKAYNDDTVMPVDEVLIEYLTRLNPSLQVSMMTRQELIEEATTKMTAAAGPSSLTEDTTGDDDVDDNDSNKAVLLCIDRPFSSQLLWNDFCRQIQQQYNQTGTRTTSPGSISFVSVETAGVYGKVFCDFGVAHAVYDADGEAPSVVPLDRITPKEDSDSVSTILTVKTIDGEWHDVSRGDVILFQRSDGSMMTESPFKVTSVKSPERIEVEPIPSTSKSDLQTIVQEINDRCVTFSRQKQVQKIPFISLMEATKQVQKGDSTVFTPCDLDKSFDETRRHSVFASFQTLNSYVEHFRRLPSVSSFEDRNEFLRVLNCIDESSLSSLQDGSTHIDTFFRTCRAKFVPLQALFGAVASQECLKAVSGLYSPIRQFLIYDCDEVLPLERYENDEETQQPLSSGMEYIFGSEIMNKLENQKLFVVGSGAIGCEILKNLASMNAGTGPAGRIIVTDMDTIEKSNLSRQLLFRDNDIGKFKSKAAQEAVHRMNSRVTLECHTSKVGNTDDPGPFDGRFWSKGVDVILNALDNMEARLFMDDQCVANEKALVDAGTLGSKGNVQVVVPHESESYGSSADPPEQAIPVCTLKNFPYTISHTIQWGRDLFDGLFVRRPRQFNQYVGSLEMGMDNLADKLRHDLGEDSALETARELAEDLSFINDIEGDYSTALIAKSIEWAVGLAKHLYFDAIEALLIEHPIDSVDDDGEPFWSGSRKMPKSVMYVSSGENNPQREAINQNLINFIRAAARLRYETYFGIPSNPRTNACLVNEQMALHALQESAAKSSDDNTVKNTDESEGKAEDPSIKDTISALDAYRGSPTELHSAEFEKDDDSNDHVAFITAASNLRAICYGIPPVDALETRKIAGKIIPAMITTTAFVSAVSCLELVKLVQPNVLLKRYRNAFINLALPFFAFTPPLPAERIRGWKGTTHTLWDRIDIKEGKKLSEKGGITLRKLLSKIQKKVDKESPGSVQISTISVGPLMIYANFLNEDDHELLDNNIWDIVSDAEISGAEFDQRFSRDSNDENKEDSDDAGPDQSTVVPSYDGSNKEFLDFSVVVEDTETCEEIELPPIRIHRYVMKRDCK